MSINFDALLDHSLAWDQLVTLDRILNEEWSHENSPLRLHLLAALRRWYDASSPALAAIPSEPWSWLLNAGPTVGEELVDHGSSLLASEVGLSGLVYRKGITLGHWLNWHSFLTDEPTQTALRGAVHHAASLVGARTVIYLPDSSYKCSAAGDVLWHGKDFPEVLAWLEQNCGPPAKSIGEIYRKTEKSWSCDGYYIEPAASKTE